MNRTIEIRPEGCGNFIVTVVIHTEHGSIAAQRFTAYSRSELETLIDQVLASGEDL